ncbi:Carnitine O-palmitoyltransferase 1, muscle isoform [Araneus ventricosus]|uniref:Carnitine O-palmitoyltransferase 1, muscle isoform n=1 Tax=Araneus ventricosus TaxID=182803 RepID=A0A4Y2NEX2_ARAVE|nr:Carnitine O-palmitoyltransferase 1, muscle isoform [Araneus ventricosus]
MQFKTSPRRNSSLRSTCNIFTEVRDNAPERISSMSLEIIFANFGKSWCSSSARTLRTLMAKNEALTVKKLTWVCDYLRTVFLFFLYSGHGNNIHCGIYPAPLSSLFILIVLVTSLFVANADITFGGIHQLEHYICGDSLAPFTVLLAACIIYSFCLWVTTIVFLRQTLKLLFMYKEWMYEVHLKKISLKTYIWATLVRTLTAKRRPMLYSFQSSLPRLPLPSLAETMERYLHTERPLLDEERYEKMKQMTYEFQNGVGK